MIPPALNVIYTTLDGTPYRGDNATGLVYVYARHVTEVTGYGFTTATIGQVATDAPGDPTTFDTGWAIAQ